MLFQPTISTFSFRHWLCRDKENQRICLFALLILIASFTWLKIIYPYPNFMPPDSYNYLEAAYNNDFINIWPIGYSKFLQFVGFFSHSHLVLVIVQYIFLQASLLYLLFTTRYILSPGKWLFRILLSVSIINPLLTHIANFVSSDCLFTALSIIWCTQLLWIIYRPNRILLVIHAFVLLFAFIVRYNALYYPFISFAVIIFSQTDKLSKWLGVIAISLVLLAFIGRTQYEYNKKTGVVQYTAFGGWQIAANALYGYAFSKPDRVEDVPENFRPLHRQVNRHMDSLAHLTLRPDREIGIYYLWDFKSPLRVHMEQSWKEDTANSFFKKWASMAPLYADYGRYLIFHHPKEFIGYYIWPNLKRYYAPPSYFMGVYNMENATVEPIAVHWFRLKNNRLDVRSDSLQIPIADIYTIALPVVNLIFITGFLSFVGLSGFRHCTKTTKRITWCVMAIWISNTIFSVLSAPIELRYQLFPLSISLIWAIVFVAYITEMIYTSPKTVILDHQSAPTVFEL